MKKILTFGEIMLRISPWQNSERVIQTNLFRVEPGGSESNVAAALAMLGHEVGFLTCLPDSPLSKIVFRYLKGVGVDTSGIVTKPGRLGTYWTENGIGPRPYAVHYDRSDSAFSQIEYQDHDWQTLAAQARLFHTSGITPAISRATAMVIEKALAAFSKQTLVSLDLNYRSKLWDWVGHPKESKAKDIMARLSSHADILLGNHADFQDSLGFNEKSTKDPDVYPRIAEKAFKRFPKLKWVAINLRKTDSASENTWSGLLFKKGVKNNRGVRGPEIVLRNIVDRVGTGDSFAAGIIHGILKYPENPQMIIDFATALGALNHTVRGDTSLFSENDVMHSLNTDFSGGIIR